MRKFQALFFALAAFFFVALAVALAYSRLYNQPAPIPAHQVALLGDHADPAQLIIGTGEWVQFNNKDGVDHDMRLNGGEAAPGAGTQFSVPAPDGMHLQFSAAGTYDYHDELHPAITIRIIVIDPTK